MLADRGINSRSVVEQLSSNATGWLRVRSIGREAKYFEDELGGEWRSAANFEKGWQRFRQRARGWIHGLMGCERG